MRTHVKAAAALVLAGLALWRCGNNNSENTEAATAPSGLLPQDVLASCTVLADSFNAWFAGGSVSANGMVTPANSVTFPHENNCDFYQWSERMFLWITSPASGAYGQGGTVLESPVFFSVTPEDASGHRRMIPHAPNTPLRMTSDLVKNGPHRLPVMRSKSGKLFEVENASPQTALMTSMVKSAEGGTVAVDHVEADGKGGFVFMDKAGKPIAAPKALIRHAASGPVKVVHRFAVGNSFVFLDAEGNVIESEEGQATGDVLMARNGSLVYYLSFVNDVYAYFLTAVSEKKMSGYEFPTTAADRDSICAFARSQGVTLPDSNALAMELKTSWVEAATLPDPENYVTVTAVIPTYDTSNPKQWIPNGEKTVQMAMIGIHIVGSVAGHPEMVWATFEHENNAPNAAYQYIDSKNNVRTVAADQGTHWLLNTNAADTPYNVSHMKGAGDTINARSGFTISQSNVQRSMPWGSAMDSVTNPQDKSSAASNSEVISINNSVRSLLPGNDKRRRYLLIGATWTDGGAAPNGSSYGSDTSPGVAIGTSVLANSTMETYLQTPSTSCFTCHSASGTPGLAPGDLSHIFDAIKPLIDTFNANRAIKK